MIILLTLVTVFLLYFIIKDFISLRYLLVVQERKYEDLQRDLEAFAKKTRDEIDDIKIELVGFKEF